MASNAQASPPRDSFAFGSAAALVSCRQTRPQRLHRKRRTHTSKRRGPMPERNVRQPPGHRASQLALGPAATPPRIRLNDTALDQRPIRRDVLADGYQPELVQAAEGGQVGRGEGSVDTSRSFGWMA